MMTDGVTQQIKTSLGMIPTAEQEHALAVFRQFMGTANKQSVMILRGSAGTGKTTLASAIVRTLQRMRRKVVLQAPTGRAAKVFALNSGHEAFTIHRKIYRQRSAAIDDRFNLNSNMQQDTLFFVDEASMISNAGMGESIFGSGRLLDDLLQYVYNGKNCRLVLLGDKAQLPPVGEEESPALIGSYLSRYGLEVFECDMNEVLRQHNDSGILFNATRIRQLITHDEVTQLPLIRFQGFADIQMVMGNELIEQLSNSYRRVGLDETMVIVRSNKRAIIYNQGIRGMILDREEELSRGDLLMVVKNHYLSTTESPAEEEVTDKEREAGEDVRFGQIGSFIANGDRARVERIRNIRQLYGFRFADVTLSFPDYDDYELQMVVNLDTLTAESPALTKEQQERLYQQIMEDYGDLSQKKERLKALREDVYYNAVQVKYAYAVTCHKAQGGQWDQIYSDQGYMSDEMLTPDYIHWLYTAFTRAREKLFLVNWPKTQIDNS
ncbi:MAG: AAA family ATPase [Prevotella sp.]|nr:AAA family ATPase [Prevotella sp.]